MSIKLILIRIKLRLNGSGQRIIGDSVEEFTSPDLVMIGPNLPHVWNSASSDAQVITIQFHSTLLNDSFLTKKAAFPLMELFEQVKVGVVFSKHITEEMIGRIKSFSKMQGFDSYIELLSILYDLSLSRNRRTLASPAYIQQRIPAKSRRIDKVDQYISGNLDKIIKIEDIAELVNMSPSAFSHFFKKRTHRSFTDYLTEKRIGLAARLLISTEKSIAEICYECGFGNISNFNRVFKLKKCCTPSQFKAQYKEASDYNIV